MTRERVAVAIAVGAALLGLAVSAGLLVDSAGPAPVFCAEGGCATVRATSWASPLGVPMPAIGLAFFAVMLALGLAGPRAARARTAIAIGGGVGALGLLILQGAVIGAWCRFCVVADASALVLAAAIALGRSRTWPRRGALTWALAAGAAGAAVGMPLRASTPARPVPAVAVATAALPDVIAREQVPGFVTVVDFVDFECPFCRTMHARLEAAIARAGVPIRVVRKMVPLSIHRGALAAAIAWCCAERQGFGDAMADALIAAPPDQLTADGCARIAAALGLDLDRYRQDLADPAILARIDRDLADARAAAATRLPTLYIGAERVLGAAATADQLVASLRRAAGA